MADPHRAERPGRVVDQVGQRLRDRRTRDGVEERVHLVRGPAGVERAPDRRRGEAVDRRLPAGLDIGQQVQVACPLARERTRGDGRQVGLDQHLVDLAGQQRCQQIGRVIAGQQGAGVRREAAERHQPEVGRLVQRRDHLVGARRRPARALPGDVRDERGRSGAGRQHLARGELGQSGQRHRAGLGCDPAGQLGVEGVARLARVVARADEERQPLRLHPRRRQAMPARGGRQVAPPVERVGRGPGRVAVGVRPGREQPGRGGHLDEQRRRRLVELDDVGRCLEVAHRHGPRAERDGRSGAPVVDEQLHSAYDVERRARRGSVHLVGGAFGGRDLGREVDPLPGRVTASHGDLDLAGRAHESRPPGHEQSARQQLLRRRRRPRPA